MKRFQTPLIVGHRDMTWVNRCESDETLSNATNRRTPRHDLGQSVRIGSTTFVYRVLSASFTEE